MGKIVYKLRPTDTWRIGEHESWFMDMSMKGLHLKKMGSLFAQFEKGEPKQIEYRIEVSNNKNISNEQIDMYEDNGWDYVTSSHYLHVFSSPKERKAPELHTDPAEQAFTMEQLNKEFNKNAILMTLSTTLFIGILGALWLLDRTPFLHLVEGTALYQSILVLYYVYQVYFVTRGMLAIRALRKNLIEGKAINHHVPWKRSLQRNKLFFTLILAIVFINTAFVFIQLARNDTYTLPIGASNLPFVRLADVEQNPNLERVEGGFSGEVHPAYYYHTNSSILAPKQYDVVEEGVIEGEKWADGSGTYSPVITTKVYQLTFKSFATPLIKDLMKMYTFGYESEPFLNLAHPDFDQLITHEQDGRKVLYASKGKVVMLVQYVGNAEMGSIIDNVAEKMKQITEK